MQLSKKLIKGGEDNRIGERKPSESTCPTRNKHATNNVVRVAPAQHVAVAVVDEDVVVVVVAYAKPWELRLLATPTMHTGWP